MVKTAFRMMTLLLCMGLQCLAWHSSALGGLIIDIRAGAALANDAVALAAFEAAASQWESRFSDDITVRIDADLVSLAGNVIGQAGSSVFQTSYTSARTALVNDSLVDADNGIVSALPTTMLFDTSAGFTIDNANVDMTTANAKALGLLNGQLNASDAVIQFNTNFAFDYDPSDGIAANLIDFVAVAAHEIGHALGFVSSVDDVDFMASGTVRPATLDLFRFATNNNPASIADFTNFNRALARGTEAIFDDLTNEWRFSTGVNFGDGRQASHWKDGLGIGLMDPTIGFGEVTGITGADVRALDLIGFNTITAVPEPSSLALCGAVASALMWRRKRVRALLKG